MFNDFLKFVTFPHYRDKLGDTWLKERFNHLLKES